MSKKYKIGKIMSVEIAKVLNKFGIAVIATDGESIQFSEYKK